MTDQEPKGVGRIDAIDPGRNRIRIVIFGLMACSLAVILFFAPVKEILSALLQWTERLGIWAPIMVILIYIISCVLFLPGSIITLGAGLLFGVVKGTVVVSIGSTLGAAAAFLVGRTLLRGWIAQKISGNERFSAIDRAVGHQGLKIVLLARLSPGIPFNLLNYAFGLTRVSLLHYLIGSWIGMLPATVLYVYLGTALGSIAELTSESAAVKPVHPVFFWMGLAATGLLLVWITRIARTAFREAVEKQNGPTG